MAATGTRICGKVNVCDEAILEYKLKRKKYLGFSPTETP
jgi:hypothetical protein